jgi:glycopeptide antibiotics resistance protein
MRFVKVFIAFGYSLSLAYLVFFARRRRHLDERFLNLIPVRNTLKNFAILDTNSTKDLYNYYSNLAGNILLFVPLPFVISLLYKAKNRKSILLIAVGVSVVIELIQYTFMIGVADIDDILLNTMGAVLGLILLRTKK